MKIKETQETIKAFSNWKKEIINSLVIRKENNKYYTNGKIEGVNNFIKTTKRQGYNYRNHERFKNRIILNYNYKKCISTKRI